MNLHLEDFKKYIFRKIYIIFTMLLLGVGLSVLALGEKFTFNNLLFNTFIIWCTITIFYLVYETINVCNIDEFNKNKKSSILIILFMIIALFSYYVYHLKTEKFIRFWDYIEYWKIAIVSGERLSNEIFNGIKEIVYSIYYNDHNEIPSLFIQSIFRFLKQGKLAYIFSIFMVYTTPLVILFGVLFSKFIKCKSNIDFNIKLIIALIIVTFSPGLNHPLLLGYIDIIGMVFILCIMIIIKDYDFSEFKLKNNILLGVLFLLLFICRRWYVYWIIGFFIAIGTSNVITEICINNDFQRFIKKIKNIFIFGFTLLIIVLLLFYPVIERIIKLDLAVAFSAYKNGGVLYEIKDLLISLGIIPTIIMFIGIAIGFYRKETREYSIMLFIIPIVAIIVFVRIQNMSLHHRYLVLPSFLLFQGIGIFGIIDLFKKINIRYIVAIILMMIYITNFVFSINSIKLGNLFTNSLIEPLNICSYDENIKIAKYIEDTYIETGEKTYILASSYIYNDGIIEGYYLPNMKMSQMLYHVNHIDLRDGFPLQFLEAKSLVVVTPEQYHMRAEDQRVIGILTNAVINVPEVAKHYELVSKWNSDENETIYYLKRISDFDSSAIDYLKNEFNKYYYNYPDLFENRLKSIYK